MLLVVAMELDTLWAAPPALCVSTKHTRDNLCAYTLIIQIDWLWLLNIDVATGGSADWAFGIHHTGLTYTFELRDVQGGPHGFILPADQIIPNCLEFLDGIKAMIQTARALNQL